MTVRLYDCTTVRLYDCTTVRLLKWMHKDTQSFPVRIVVQSYSRKVSKSQGLLHEIVVCQIGHRNAK